MPIRNAISLRPPPATTGRETLENAAKIKAIVYPCRSDLRNSFFMALWKQMTDRKIAAGRKENIWYSPSVRSGLPQPEENFSRQIPVIPRSIKKIKRAILIFLGKNLNSMAFFHILILVIPWPRAYGATRLHRRGSVVLRSLWGTSRIHSYY